MISNDQGLIQSDPTSCPQNCICVMPNLVMGFHVNVRAYLTVSLYKIGPKFGAVKHMETEKDTDFRQTVLSNVQLEFNVFLWILSLKEVKNTIRKNNL